MRRALALTVVAVLACTAAGCGGESRHDVRLSVEQLASISAEGSLMADDVARGRTKTTFVRVHGEELSSQAEHEAEKLNDASVSPDLHSRVEAAVKLSSDIGGAIDDLRVSPHDRQQALQAEHNLHRLADEAQKLAGSM